MKTRSLLLALVVVAASTAVWACSVPVCRYALERWRTDSYEVLVFHRGELSAEHQQTLSVFKPDDVTGDYRANVRVRTVDVDGELTPRDALVWEEHKQHADELPRMSVRFPNPRVGPRGMWHGPLNADAIETMFDSPLRQDVADELIKGTSAVWILLESGNKDADDAAADELKKQLTHLEKTLEISKPDAQDVAEGLIDIDPSRLELSFRMFRLSRDSEEEKFFAESLLHSEADLLNEEFAGQPIAFSVFGRGRVLYGLMGRGINGENIKEACEFLTGPCSCQVKEQNPGVDLLMAVNWEALVNPSSTPEATELPPLAGLNALKDRSNESGSEDELPEDVPEYSIIAPGAAKKSTEELPAPEKTTDRPTNNIPAAAPAARPASYSLKTLIIGFGVIVALASLILLRR